MSQEFSLSRAKKKKDFVLKQEARVFKKMRMIKTSAEKWKKWRTNSKKKYVEILKTCEKKNKQKEIKNRFEKIKNEKLSLTCTE